MPPSKIPQLTEEPSQYDPSTLGDPLLDVAGVELLLSSVMNTLGIREVKKVEGRRRPPRFPLPQLRYTMCGVQAITRLYTYYSMYVAWCRMTSKNHSKMLFCNSTTPVMYYTCHTYYKRHSQMSCTYTHSIYPFCYRIKEGTHSERNHNKPLGQLHTHTYHVDPNIPQQECS